MTCICGHPRECSCVCHLSADLAAQQCELLGAEVPS